MALLSPVRAPRCVRLAFWWVAVLLAVTARAQPGSSGPTELQVKAAFLLHFASFVEWPPQELPSRTTPLIVGIYGRDPFGAALDEIFAGEAVRNHPFVIRRIPRGGDWSGCHILFIADSERRDYAAIVARVRNSPCLTVANGPGFNRAGGIIEFVTVGGKIRFSIDRPAAEKAGLVLSSKLLRLSHSSQ